MAQRSKLWWVAAAVFIFVNVAGIIYGAATANPAHTAAHVAILAVGFVAWKVLPWGRQQTSPSAPQLDERRVEYLQQSVDAIALEVERIGEKQRFSDKLRVERGEVPPLKKDT